MKVTFWGVRGSIPMPGTDTARYGGNTPCISVEEGNAMLVLDAGTGIRGLGLELAFRRYAGTIDLLLSHSHVDHIQGLPFFAPIHDPASPVRIYGPASDPVSLREVLARQMIPPLWPEAYRAVSERLNVTEITAGDFQTGYFGTRAIMLRHPGRTLGFSISSPVGSSKSLNYLTDNELALWLDTPDWQKSLVSFLRNGAVLIHDATYNEMEIPSRSGWGHSSGSQAVDLAVAAGVERLILFHHAPEHDDKAVDALLTEARRRVAATGGKLRVDAATEGLTIDI